MIRWAAVFAASFALLTLAVAKFPVKWVFAQQEQLVAPHAAMPATPAPESTRVKLRTPTRTQTPEHAARASAGCLSCHTGIEHPNMHMEATVVLGCTDCHGGNATIMRTSGTGTDAYDDAKQKAHVQPIFPEDAERGDHPVRAYARWIKESYEFVKFADPGDLRAAPETCGGCHAAETRNFNLLRQIESSAT